MKTYIYLLFLAPFFLAMNDSGSAGDCETDIILDGTITDVQNHVVVNTIKSTQVLTNTAEVVYQAGDWIHLEPGFHAQQGSSFYTLLYPCVESLHQGTSSSAKIASPSNENLEIISLSCSPNPFQHSTTIKYQLETEALIRLKITDITGKIVAQPIEKTLQNKGYYSIDFAVDDLGAGLYFCTLYTNTSAVTKQLIITK